MGLMIRKKSLKVSSDAQNLGLNWDNTVTYPERMLIRAKPDLANKHIWYQASSQTTNKYFFN